jgi:hypothetical protein
MSLLYNLFVESSILPENLAFRKNEFLSEASYAIVSSLAESNPDIGAQLAVRLLIPYTVYQKNDELVANISSILECYNPTADHYVETLFSYLDSLIALKSRQTVDSCIRIVLYLYGRQKSKFNMVSAMQIILKGIEIETGIYPSKELGLCYKTLASECQRISLSLLKSLTGKNPFDPETIMIAKGIALGLDQNSFDCTHIPETTELQRVLYIMNHHGKDGYDRDVAKCITACLDRKEDSRGVFLNKSQSPSHFILLQLACHQIVDYGKGHIPTSGKLRMSPFDKKGITLLLERLMHLGGSGLYPTCEIIEMKQILATGLHQAFVSENFMKRQREVVKASSRLDISTIRSTNLNDFDVSIQEQVVRRMLEY